VYTLFGPPPLPHFWQNLFHPLILPFCWKENISDNKKDLSFLLVWDKDSYTEIPSVASMHMCISTIGSSLPDLFTTCWSPSHSGLSQFKITIFAPLQWAHQPHSSFRFSSLSVILLSWNFNKSNFCSLLLLKISWGLYDYWNLCFLKCTFLSHWVNFVFVAEPWNLFILCKKVVCSMQF
jgi:hypothetical protein